jgi:hypothetical protein
MTNPMTVSDARVPIQRGLLALVTMATMPLVSTPLRSQDRGVLILKRGSETIGREEFVVRRGRGSGALAGFTVVSTAWYPAERPERSLESVVEVGPDSSPTAVRLEAGNGDPKRVLIALGRDRVTVRSLTSAGESAREYPATQRHVLVDDSLFAPHVFPPKGIDGEARTLSLGGGRGAPARIVDHGTVTTTVGTSTLTLRHVSILSPQIERHLWYDERGRLIKVEDPRLGLTVIRSGDIGG